MSAREKPRHRALQRADRFAHLLIEELGEAVGHVLQNAVEHAPVDAVGHHAAGEHGEQDETDDRRRAGDDQRRAPHRQAVAGRPEPQQRRQGQQNEQQKRGLDHQRETQPNGGAAELGAVDEADEVERGPPCVVRGGAGVVRGKSGTAPDIEAVEHERMDEGEQVDVVDADGCHEGPAAKDGGGRPGAAPLGPVGGRRLDADELGDVDVVGEGGGGRPALVGFGPGGERGVFFKQDPPVGVGDQMAVEEPGQVSGGLPHQRREFRGALNREQIDGSNHGFRALEAVQGIVDLAVPLAKATTVGQPRLHAVPARVQPRPRRRFPTVFRRQQLPEADALGVRRAVDAAALRGEQAKPRRRRDVDLNGRAQPRVPPMRAHQAAQLLPEGPGRPVVLLVALEQRVGGQPVPIAQALRRGRSRRRQRLVWQFGFRPAASRGPDVGTARRAPGVEERRHALDHPGRQAERGTVDDAGQALQHLVHAHRGGVESPEVADGRVLYP